MHVAARRHQGTRDASQVVIKRLTLTGFIVSDYADEWAEAKAELAALHAAGQLRARETVYAGFEALPEAFVGLFDGANTGKAVVSV